jgi:hypothetical protein
MLNAILAILTAALWLSSYGLFFAPDVIRWWRMRPYYRAQSEFERLEAVRAYADWVRNMPPPPPRKTRPAAIVPVPELPPRRGVVVPFPGRISNADEQGG